MPRRMFLLLRGVGVGGRSADGAVNDAAGDPANCDGVWECPRVRFIFHFPTLSCQWAENRTLGRHRVEAREDFGELGSNGWGGG
jgi:hypothetical protein